MRFTFVVTAEVLRQQGLFASREEIARLLTDEIEGADPGTLTTDNDAEYEVTGWSVEES